MQTMGDTADHDAKRLDLHRLEHRHPALPPETAGHFRLVAGVCMTRHHQPPIAWLVQSDTHGNDYYELDWPVPTPAAQRQCAELNDAVTVAAYCIALAAADQHLGLKGLRRVEHRLGADYYLVPSDAPVSDDVDLDLERDDLVRLEVSGIDDDTDRTLRARVRAKVAQVSRRKHPTPGMAGVAAFRTARVVFETAAFETAT
jgi:hypothetical protein